MLIYTKTPKSFVLQWHITERCNWHCKHCYRKDIKVDEVPLNKLQEVVEQYIHLIKKWGIKKEKTRIRLIGGEPLLRKDFLKLAEVLHNNRKIIRWELVSNGSLINKDIAKKLKKFGVYVCQISIEGCEKNNDTVRGKGSFKKILKAIKCLTEQDIQVRASLTLTKQNINDIPKLVKLFKDIGVSYFSTHRLVPQGRGVHLIDKMLNREELINYYKWVDKTNKELRINKENLILNTSCDSGISNSIKSYDLLVAKKICGLVSGEILAVMPNGNVMPCRRVPIIIGNIFEESLEKIWKADLLRKIRNISNAHMICKKCKDFETCFGGAKCVTYAYNGKLFAPDIACQK